MTRLALIIGKIISVISKTLGFGAGATWPGEIALAISPRILPALVGHLRFGTVMIAGTNGKTTTASMIKTILEKKNLRVVHNASGANLINGIVSAFIGASGWNGTVNADWGVFEVDENTVPMFIENAKPKVVVLLNLFRDQLDRYGEIDIIAEKWERALARLSGETKVILNSDDPQIAHIGKFRKRGVVYFGVDDKKSYLPHLEHATDSIFCLNCGGRLSYEGIYFSHIGIWCCSRCGEKRPKPQLTHFNSPLPGLYNRYNTLAAVACARALDIRDNDIRRALSTFRPAFGRQEEFSLGNKKIKVFLSKNPAGFNESLRTVLEFKPKTLLLALNDRIPDGRDVSWIWDVDLEMIPSGVNLIASGDRVWDMALRIKYVCKIQNPKSLPAGRQVKQIQHLVVEPNLTAAIDEGLSQLNVGETLYVLPTYSAMLEVRKILTGHTIL